MAISNRLFCFIAVIMYIVIMLSQYSVARKIDISQLTEAQIRELRELQAQRKAQKLAQASAKAPVQQTPKPVETPIAPAPSKPLKISAEKRAELAQKALAKWRAKQANTNKERILRNNQRAKMVAANQQSQRIAKKQQRRKGGAGKRVEGGVVSYYSKEDAARMTPQIKAEADTRKSELLAKLRASKDGSITLSYAEFNKYVASGPRPYWLMVTFTALGSNWRCPNCQTYQAAVAPVLTSLQKRYETDVRDELPVFYVVVDAGRDAEIWRHLNLQTAPINIIMPPVFTSRSVGMKELIDSTPIRQNVGNNPTSSDVVSFIGKHTNVHIELPQASVSILKLLSLFAGLFAVLAGVYFLWDKLLFLQRLRLLYSILAVLGYVYGVSGGMFNTLNKTMFTGFDRSGFPIYISAGHQEQYGAESVILGLCYFFCAAVVVLLVAVAFTRSLSSKDLVLTKDVEANPSNIIDDVESDAHAGRLITKYTGQAGPAVILGLLVFLYIQIIRVYQYKNGGYRMGFVW